MMKKFKKPVSILLSLLMVVGMFAIVPITANAADPATFTVTWKNWNGDTLETDTAVAKDSLPTYDGAVPARADDEKNTYTFAAWDDGTTTYLLNEALPPVTGDVTYTAIFTAEEKHAGELETLELTNYYEKINETNYAKEHTGENVSVEPTSIMVRGDQNGWYLETENGGAEILALKGKMINELVVKGTDNGGVPTVKVGANTISATSRDGNTFTFKNVNSNKATVYAAEDIQVSSIDVYVTGEKDFFAGHSLSLEGDIGLNFFIDPSEAGMKPGDSGELKVSFAWEDDEALVDVASQSTTVTVNTTNYSQEGDLIKVTCNVCAAEMTCNIVATATLNGKTFTEVYRVSDYCRSILNASDEWIEAYNASLSAGSSKTYENLCALIVDMLDYGTKAQNMFGVYTYRPAISTIPHAIPHATPHLQTQDVTEEMFDAAILAANGEEADDIALAATDFGAKYYSTSMIFLSKSTLRHYFTKINDTFDPNAFDGEKYGIYYVEVTDIPAAELDVLQSFKVGDTTFKYSALDYAKAVAGSSNASKEHKNLVKSMYWYNDSANKFFGESPVPVSNIVNLSKLRGDYEAQDGQILTGTLSGDKKITIADGATVTLRNANITGLSPTTHYAGITPVGNATIILEGTNTVKGGHEDYPGIFAAENATLTIDGEGSLTALPNGYTSGIGGGYKIPAGNIVINGGTITATGVNGAGIGSGEQSSCGDITINGGTVTAQGGYHAAAIGSGYDAVCGNITIADTVTQVIATRGTYALNFIGAGVDGTCGTVTIAESLISKEIENTLFIKAPVDLSKLTSDYEAQDGDILTGTLAGDYKITIADGAAVTLEDANITYLTSEDKYAGITPLGDADIFLEGTNTVKGGYEDYPGIYAPEGKTLTIDGTGSLDASSNGAGCGIGGGWNVPAGNIIINGGTITATGGKIAAGIGSGDNSPCGNITINGGDITATGGNNGAGIGSGSDNSSCGSIEITGGTVKAAGGSSAAGIGSGARCNVENITISGGTVEAAGDNYGAGIGSGSEGSCGNISITRGTVTAAGGKGAASIGSGEGGSCGTILIDDTIQKVTAVKGENALVYIGAGNNGTSGTVTIAEDLSSEETDNTLVLKSHGVVDLSTLNGDYEAQDGETLTSTLDGDHKITIADGATVTLKNANITCLSSNAKYAGITPLGNATILLKGTNTVTGGDVNYPGIYAAENATLTIDGTGSLYAMSNGYGSGIGGGLLIAAGNIVINGGDITAYGGISTAGIGGGYKRACGDITITGGTVSATGGNSAAGIGGGPEGSCGNITIADTVTQVTATKGTGASNSIGAGNGGTCGTVTITDGANVIRN